MHEGDEAGAVRVVLDGRDLAGDAEVVALEVDRAVQLLVAAPAEARGDAALVVVPGVAVEVLDQRTVRVSVVTALRSLVLIPRRPGEVGL